MKFELEIDKTKLEDALCDAIAKSIHHEDDDVRQRILAALESVDVQEIVREHVTDTVSGMYVNVELT